MNSAESGKSGDFSNCARLKRNYESLCGEKRLFWFFRLLLLLLMFVFFGRLWTMICMNEKKKAEHVCSVYARGCQCTRLYILCVHIVAVHNFFFFFVGLIVCVGLNSRSRPWRSGQWTQYCLSASLWLFLTLFFFPCSHIYTNTNTYTDMLSGAKIFSSFLIYFLYNIFFSVSIRPNTETFSCHVDHIDDRIDSLKYHFPSNSIRFRLNFIIL